MFRRVGRAHTRGIVYTHQRNCVYTTPQRMDRSIFPIIGGAFGSSSLIGYCSSSESGKTPRGVTGYHCWANLNDGIYGNSHSWIGATQYATAGVVLPTPRKILGIQFARDLGGESHVYGDRAGGAITVEYSATANRDATPWVRSIGWLDQLGTHDRVVDPHWTNAGTFTRWDATKPNYYWFSPPVVADGLHITLEDGITCVDELDIYAPTYNMRRCKTESWTCSSHPKSCVPAHTCAEALKYEKFAESCTCVNEADDVSKSYTLPGIEEHSLGPCESEQFDHFPTITTTATILLP